MGKLSFLCTPVLFAFLLERSITSIGFTGETYALPCEHLWLRVVEETTRRSTRARYANFTDTNNTCKYSVNKCEILTTIFQGVFQNKPSDCHERSPEPHNDFGHFDLCGVELRVITAPWPPYIIKETDDQGATYVTGLSIDLIKEMQMILNFTFVLEWEQDSWGMLQDDGNWTGMVGQLQRKEKDMIIGALGFQAERTSVMDFSLVYDELRVRMWILDPRRRPPSWLALFEMVDLTVMGLLAGAIFLLAILLSVCSIIVPEGFKARTFLQCFIIKAFALSGAILAQGTRVQLVTYTGMLIHATWWMFSVVFSITYRAMLIAFLSANFTRLPFESAEAVMYQTEYKYGFLGDASVLMYFKDISNNSVYRTLWQNTARAAIADPELLSPDYTVHVQKVTQEKYVFIGEELPWYHHSGELSPVLSFGEDFFRMKICLGLQLNSPYTASMSHSLKVLLQHGIVSRLKKKWLVPQASRSAEISEVNGIPMNTLIGVFFTMGIGLGLSIIVFVTELVLKFIKCHTRKLRNGK